MLLDEPTSALDPEMVGGVRDVIRSIADASKRSDLTIFSLHTHEGVNENWCSSQPPEFIEKIAHDAIDAGADVVVGHGAHFCAVWRFITVSRFSIISAACSWSLRRASPSLPRKCTRRMAMVRTAVHPICIPIVLRTKRQLHRF